MSYKWTVPYRGCGKGGNCCCKKVHKLTHYLCHTRLLFFYVEHAPFRVGRIVITHDLVVVWCVSHAVFFHSWWKCVCVGVCEYKTNKTVNGCLPMHLSISSPTYPRLGRGGDLQSWIIKCPTPGDNTSGQIPCKSPRYKAGISRGIDPENIYQVLRGWLAIWSILETP